MLPFIAAVLVATGLGLGVYLGLTMPPRQQKFVPPPPRCRRCRVIKGTTPDLCSCLPGARSGPHDWEDERIERFEMPPVSRPPYAS